MSTSKNILKEKFSRSHIFSLLHLIHFPLSSPQKPEIDKMQRSKGWLELSASSQDWWEEVVPDLSHSPLYTKQEGSGFHLALLLTRSHSFFKFWFGFHLPIKDIRSLPSNYWWSMLSFRKKKSMLFLIWALNFVRTFFASVEMIIWFIFILQFVNVIYHIDWFAYINQWAPIVFKHCYQALEDTQIESWCPQPANVYSLLKKTGKHMHNDNAGCTLLSWR